MAPGQEERGGSLEPPSRFSFGKPPFPTEGPWAGCGWSKWSSHGQGAKGTCAHYWEVRKRSSDVRRGATTSRCFPGRSQFSVPGNLSLQGAPKRRGPRASGFRSLPGFSTVTGSVSAVTRQGRDVCLATSYRK